jgi:predicted TIM-barrel fold metal-dependent hydrolase
MRIIDGDGHIFEDEEAIKRYLPAAWHANTTTRTMGVFPQLDHLHNSLHVTPPGAFQNPGVEGWVRFLDELHLDAAVLYPTAGLSFGKLTDVELAATTARAYNNWLHDVYLKRDARFKGVGLIPFQDPEAAVAELRRIVTEHGMVGALVPSTGLKTHLGDTSYWPIYAEADRLGCALAVHGGAHSGLGFDQLNVFAAIHALGHPMGIAIVFASMALNGVFDRFPNVRFGFMEGGVSWFLMALERLESSYNAFTPYLSKLALERDESVSDYLIRHTKAGRIFVGVEGEEPELAYAVQRLGPEAFVFSTDFPHEVNTESCKHEVEEILTNGALDERAKRAIFSDNAARFYGLGEKAHVINR